MKTFTKPVICYLVIALLSPVLAGSSGLKTSETTQVKNQPFQRQAITERSHSYHAGMITIKVKAGVEIPCPQLGSTDFTVPSLNAKASKFSINKIEKRFKHKPIPKDSGLPDLSRIYRICFSESLSVNEVIRAFQEDPNIEYAEPVPVDQVAEVPNDALYDLCQHLSQIFAPSAWDIHKGENGAEEVIVAIVDTGIEWDHEDLQSNVWQNLAEDADGDGHTMELSAGQWVLDPGDINGIDDDGNGFTDDLIGWNFASNSNDPKPLVTNPLKEHGTHCAGIAAGATNNGAGIASVSYNVSVMGICADANNTLAWGYPGIIYAAENGAHVISNSWGGTNYSLANQEAIDYATGLGSILVACAHNYNNEIPIYPASYTKAISVASVGVTDYKATYSNYGAMIDVAAPGGDYVDGGILSCISTGYSRKMGTSMATPMVAGLMALVQSYHPEWSSLEVLTQVIGSADDISSLNPDYIHKLGSGRINAFRALSETGISLPEEAKVALESFTFTDENGNNIIEPGETVDFDFTLHNYSMFECTENFTLTLISSDPEITVSSGAYTCIIPPDGSFEVNDVFQVEVSDQATCHMGNLKITIDGAVPVVIGNEIPVNPLIAPEGVLVIDGNDKQTDLSGWYINEITQQLGVPMLYSYGVPESSIQGFDAVFLSFGNFGSNYIPFDNTLASKVYLYLVNGGRVYIEGGDALGFDQAGNTGLLNKLGLASVNDGTAPEKPITQLEGQEGTLTEGMLFTGSTQSSNIWIDIYNPINAEDAAFIESTLGKVGVQYAGSYGQKSFCFSYTLASLADANETSSRNQLIFNILEFFDLDIPAGYLLGEFKQDTLYGAPPFDVNFEDISISDPDNPVSAWQWDFDNDGVTDSYEENPTWTYTEKGCFSVRLIVSNGIQTDTIFKENHIDTKAVPFGTWTLGESPYEINHRILVPEGQTLVIEPGVEVMFTGHYKFSVEGCLLAIGTAEDSILFTAQDKATGWHHLEIIANPATNDTSKLSYCIVEHGQATGGGGTLDNLGGGIAISGAHAVISNSTIRNNLADENGYYGPVGGGIIVNETSAIITDCDIINNTARDGGGGICLAWSPSSIIKGCLIANNIQPPNTQNVWEMGGLFLYNSFGFLINNTITNNQGGGIGFMENSNPDLINNIIWGNESTISHNVTLVGMNDDPNFKYCDIKDGLEGFSGDGAGSNFYGLYENNIDVDPLYIDPENGDFHLTENSPCIDAGDPAQPYDPDGTISDIGAYYYDQLTGIKEVLAPDARINVSPNPVHATGMVSYTLEEDQFAEISVFDVQGGKVIDILEGYRQAGTHTLTFRTDHLPNGIYYCVLKISSGTQTVKMIKL